MENTQSIPNDDAADVEAKMREYIIDRAAKKDVEGIIEHVYALPVNIALPSGERIVYTSADDVREGLARLWKRREAVGHVKTEIQNVNVCILADGLALADVTSKRMNADGQPIPNWGFGAILYVLQKFAGEGWRITSFCGRDPNKKLTFGN